MNRQSGSPSREKAIERAMSAVALVFLVKAVILAFWVTPLWDVPDESGHFAIIADLAGGRGLPVPGKSVLPADVLADWTRGAGRGPVLNWVAQHPPLYHLLAAPLAAAARLATNDPRWFFRSPRLLSALAGAAALLFFFAAFRESTGDSLLAFVAAAALGLIPMYSHLASGANHDVFLAFVMSVASLCWVRFARSGLFSDGMKMAAALALAGAVKLSALVPAAVLCLLAWKHLSARRGRRVAQTVAIGAVSCSLALLWTLRHWWLVGNARVHPVSREPFRVASFLGYLRGEPVVDHTFKNFFGLIGWTGTGAGNVRWFQISGVFLAPYILLALAGALGAGAWLWRKRRRAGAATFLAAGAAAAVFAFCLLWLFSAADGAESVKRLLYSLLVAVPLLALPLAFERGAAEDSVIAESHLVFLVFGAAYLVNSFEAFEIYGQMRATNGRYFFAVLPFLAFAFVLAPARLLRPGRVRDALLLALLAALFVNEAAFFLSKVIPFYRGATA